MLDTLARRLPQRAATKTLILVRPQPAGGTADLTTLNPRLDSHRGPRSTARSSTVDADAVVAALNAQADTQPRLPVREEPRRRRDQAASSHAYREANPSIQYVVVVGGDDVIPFFRYPDPALLGNETLYVPPVRDNTRVAGEPPPRLRAERRLPRVERRASRCTGTHFPVPDLAIGRLVETPAEIAGMLDAYLGRPAASCHARRRRSSTGYDFLTDAADEIAGHLQAGIGGTTNNDDADHGPGRLAGLITTAGNAADPHAQLDGDRPPPRAPEPSGTTSSSSPATSARTTRSPPTTRRTSSRPSSPPSPANLVNTIVFSAGCHAGYNIVNGARDDGAREPLDWAQAFAQKRATLIAGTGYQYGDTDFVAHSERLYAEFARQLRLPPGLASRSRSAARSCARSSGSSRTTPGLSALDEKALLADDALRPADAEREPAAGPHPRHAEPLGRLRPIRPVAAGPGAELGLKVVRRLA